MKGVPEMSCQIMADEVVSLLRQREGPVAAFNASADSERRRMNWSRALELGSQGLRLCLNKPTMEARGSGATTHMYMGAVYHSMGDLAQAMECYRQSANSFCFMSDPDCQWNEVVAYYAMGLVAQSRGSSIEAQGLYEKSLDLLEKHPSEDVHEDGRLKKRIAERMKYLAVGVTGRAGAGRPLLPVQPDQISPSNIQLGGQTFRIKKTCETSKGGVFALKAGNEYGALEVEGDSMRDAGIESGDYVIVKKQHEAEQGDIVVVCIGDMIADACVSGLAVKQYYQKYGTTIRLKAANPEFQPQEMTFKASDPTIAILGKVVAVLSPKS
jgi:tetratricopeptide (TPR) repeat protein